MSAPSSNAAAVFLNSDSYSVDAPLSVDDTGFLVNFPLSMNPGDTATGVLFTVWVPPAIPIGNYYGYFQILGGSDGSELNAISNLAPFEIYAVPEPGSLLLLGTGGLALMGALRRKLL